MNRKIMVTALFALAAQPCLADQAADIRQWKPSLKSMFTLVQSGFRVMGMTEYQGTKNGARNFTYLLQKDNDVFQCLEDTITDPSSKKNSTNHSSWHLVGIFAYDPNDKNYLEQ